MSLIFSLVCLAILAFGALVGFIRRSNRMLVRLGTLILSVFISFFLSRGLVKTGVEKLIGTLLPRLVSNPEAITALTGNPELTEAVGVISQMIAGPLVFFAVYLLLKAITLIVYKIICVIFRIRGPKVFLLGRLCGMGVGLLCGVVGVLVLTVPVCGYIGLVEQTVIEVTAEDSGEQNAIPEELTAVFELNDAPIAKQVYALFGDTLFEGLTTAKWGEDEISLQQEIGAILTVLDNVKQLGGTSVDSFGKEQSDAVRGMLQGVSDSGLLTHLGAGVLSDASNAWLAGESYMGVSAPTVPDDLRSIFGAFLTVFSTSTPDNIKNDLGTFADVFDLMVEHELFALLGSSDGEQEGTSFLDKLMSTDIVEEFYAVLDKNPRMYPVRVAISDTGMKMLYRELGGTIESVRENHGELMDEVADVLKDVAVDEQGRLDADDVTEKITGALNQHNVELDESAVRLLADSFVDEFTAKDLEELTIEQIVDRVIDRMASTDQ